MNSKEIHAALIPSTQQSKGLSQCKPKILDSQAVQNKTRVHVIEGHFHGNISLFPQDDVSSIRSSSSQSFVDVPHDLVPSSSAKKKPKQQSIIKDEDVEKSYHLAPLLLKQAFDPQLNKTLLPEYKRRLDSIHTDTVKLAEQFMMDRCSTICTLMNLPTAPEGCLGNYAKSVQYYANLAISSNDIMSQSDYYANDELLRKYAVLKCLFINDQQHIIDYVKKVLEAMYFINIGISPDDGTNFVENIVRAKIKSWDKALSRKLWKKRKARFYVRNPGVQKQKIVECHEREVSLVFAHVSVWGVFYINHDQAEGTFSSPNTDGDSASAHSEKLGVDEESDKKSTDGDSASDPLGHFTDESTSKVIAEPSGTVSLADATPSGAPYKKSDPSPTKTTRSNKAGLIPTAVKKTPKAKQGKKKRHIPEIDVGDVSTCKFMLSQRHYTNCH